jgi:hypothetical protein
MFKVEKSEMVSGDGNLKFEFFLKLYKSSMMWNKILFLDIKKEMLKERRAQLVNSSSAKSS